MKTFHCTHCHNLVFFENSQCLACGQTLAWLPDLRTVAALEQHPDGLWYPLSPDVSQGGYRMCANQRENICNWAVGADDPQALCASCRLTRVIPDLQNPGNRQAWYRLELAKRRLLYSLQSLQLPVYGKHVDAATGLEFELKEDASDRGGERVLTGHDHGLIVLNIAEADDVLREQQRQRQHEPYRTLLGHFRHEIGHYYWDRLIEESPRLEEFRQLFGDERADYGAALQRHYENGPPADWQSRFISAYATSHPWEDWAESWAHYLHISDTLETAGDAGLSLRPVDPAAPALEAPVPDPSPATSAFDPMIAAWVPLTYVLNNLNRGLGLQDGYPFVLSETIIAKLRFIHETIFHATTAPQSNQQSNQQTHQQAQWSSTGTR